MKFAGFLLLGLLAGVRPVHADAGTIEVTWQRRDDQGRLFKEKVSLTPSKTAFVVIDMWDQHWCKTYTARVGEMVPHMNATLAVARKLGIQVVFAPSDVLQFYADYPQRKAMLAIPQHADPPARVVFSPPRCPVTEGLCECGPDFPCRSRGAWTRQVAGLVIAPADLIADCNNARELFNLCAERGLDTLIFLGVASNMCVPGRSCGMLNTIRHGFRVAFFNDLVEAISANGYDPRTRVPDWNFTPAKGSALIQAYLEQYVAPSLDSVQLFAAAGLLKDARPHVVFVIADPENKTADTLPLFAEKYLGKGYRCDFVVAPSNAPAAPGELPALGSLYDVDLVVLSVGRKAFPVPKMDHLERYLRSDKPLVALRPSVAAFQAEARDRPDGYVIWPGFSAEILGCEYRGWDNNARKTGTDVWATASAAGHPILRGLGDAHFHSASWPFDVTPLAASTKVLLMGHSLRNQPDQPVAWTNSREGRRVFYTCLGQPEDFENDSFNRLLKNAIDWSLEKEVMSAAGNSGPSTH